MCHILVEVLGKYSYQCLLLLNYYYYCFWFLFKEIFCTVIFYSSIFFFLQNSSKLLTENAFYVVLVLMPNNMECSSIEEVMPGGKIRSKNLTILINKTIPGKNLVKFNSKYKVRGEILVSASVKPAFIIITIFQNGYCFSCQGYILSMCFTVLAVYMIINSSKWPEGVVPVVWWLTYWTATS